MRRTLLLILALCTACSGGSGLTKDQADGCNTVLDAGRDFTAQLSTVVNGGDVAAATTAVGADVRTVRAQAAKQNGDIGSAMNDVATEMSRLQENLANVDQAGGVDALVSATTRLNTACKIT